MPRNVVVAQSGGPSPVINNSLRGVLETCKRHPDKFGTVYAGWHGIEGVLKEELLDLSAQAPDEVALLRVTPTAGSIGTCRYKLKKEHAEDFDRVIEVFKRHDVGYFFYIGGNDSMDTANKVSLMAREKGLELVGIGVPKTIDNDVGDSEFKLIDHTPGYGSVARYWLNTVAAANEENSGSSPADPVLVLQAMGRKIGFIPAAARLADPGRELPLLIFLAESNLTLEEVHAKVNETLGKHGRAIVVVSEGFNIPEDVLGATRDAFGHVQFSASRTTVAQVFVNYLNDKGLCVPGSARGQVPGTDQRGSIYHASPVDLEEAYRVGEKAAELAAENQNGQMATILRKRGSIYGVHYANVPLHEVANSERAFPKHWITADKADVTDEFLAYAQPLVGEDWVSVPLLNGRPRFTRFKPIFAEKKCPAYVPVGYRKKK
ncbi:MAG: diphosphate--fructose-6-phosphate 1-phosphotransferase [Planctomycetota bacterium]|nr:diphosphate--fructose-6-phosphate 1-phosphotransferase [Planctomycetota bacterium]